MPFLSSLFPNRVMIAMLFAAISVCCAAYCMNFAALLESVYASYLIGTIHAYASFSVMIYLWRQSFHRPFGWNFRLSYAVMIGIVAMASIFLFAWEPAVILILSCVISIVAQLVMIQCLESPSLRFVHQNDLADIVPFNHSRFTLDQVLVLTTIVAIVAGIARLVSPESMPLTLLFGLITFDCYVVMPYMTALLVLGSRHLSTMAVRALFRAPLFGMTTIFRISQGEHSLSACALDCTVLAWSLIIAASLRSSGLRLVRGEGEYRDPFE